MTTPDVTIPVEVDEWWCPVDQRWTMCPGPCPDGQEHTEHRVITVQARLGQPGKREGSK